MIRMSIRMIVMIIQLAVVCWRWDLCYKIRIRKVLLLLMLIHGIKQNTIVNKVKVQSGSFCIECIFYYLSTGC